MGMIDCEISRVVLMMTRLIKTSNKNHYQKIGERDTDDYY
jgi:hypothetical protein